MFKKQESIFPYPCILFLHIVVSKVKYLKPTQVSMLANETNKNLLIFVTF